MTVLHKIILYGLLLFLGVSLVLPGLFTLLNPELGSHGLRAEHLADRHHLRALNGMLVGIGVMALWACVDLASARMLVMALGALLVCLVAARLYSWWMDGMPGFMNLVYLAVEAVMAGVFLAWPPPLK